jgi:hypothetical protein
MISTRSATPSLRAQAATRRAASRSPSETPRAISMRSTRRRRAAARDLELLGGVYETSGVARRRAASFHHLDAERLAREALLRGVDLDTGA